MNTANVCNQSIENLEFGIFFFLWLVVFENFFIESILNIVKSK